MTFNELVYARIVSIGMSPLGISELTSIPPTTLYRFLDGGTMSVKYMERLCEKTGISLKVDGMEFFGEGMFKESILFAMRDSKVSSVSREIGCDASCLSAFLHCGRTLPNKYVFAIFELFGIKAGLRNE